MDAHQRCLLFCSTAHTGMWHWMGSNDLLSSHFTVLLLSLNHGNIKIREKISEKILEMLGIELGAAGQEASMLSTVLCGPPRGILYWWQGKLPPKAPFATSLTHLPY